MVALGTGAAGKQRTLCRRQPSFPSNAYVTAAAAYMCGYVHLELIHE